MTQINDQINALLVPLLRRPDTSADALEALANGLAGTIAILARGDTDKANSLLTGTEGYIQAALSDKLRAMRAIYPQ